jgi:hypothetical protein
MLSSCPPPSPRRPPSHCCPRVSWPRRWLVPPMDMRVGAAVAAATCKRQARVGFGRGALSSGGG